MFKKLLIPIMAIIMSVSFGSAKAQSGVRINKSADDFRIDEERLNRLWTEDTYELATKAATRHDKVVLTNSTKASIGSATAGGLLATSFLSKKVRSNDKLSKRVLMTSVGLVVLAAAPFVSTKHDDFKEVTEIEIHTDDFKNILSDELTAAAFGVEKEDFDSAKVSKDSKYKLMDSIVKSVLIDKEPVRALQSACSELYTDVYEDTIDKQYSQKSVYEKTVRETDKETFVSKCTKRLLDSLTTTSNQ